MTSCIYVAINFNVLFVFSDGSGLITLYWSILPSLHHLLERLFSSLKLEEGKEDASKHNDNKYSVNKNVSSGSGDVPPHLSWRRGQGGFVHAMVHQLDSSVAGKKFNKFVEPRGRRGVKKEKKGRILCLKSKGRLVKSLRVCESGKRKLTLDRSDSPGAKLRRLAK